MDYNNKKVAESQKIRIELAKVASYEAKYKIALKKIAELERDKDIRDTVLQLVAEGIIDAYEGPAKVASYSNDPNKFEMIKQANIAGLNVEVFDGLVEPVVSDKEKKESSPTKDFEDRLKRFVTEDKT